LSGWDDLGVADVITASEQSWTALFTGLSPVSHQQADGCAAARGRRCSPQGPAVEIAVHEWRADGAPPLDKFTITVTPEGQNITWPKA